MVLPYFTEEHGSSVKSLLTVYGRTMFFRKIRKNMVLPITEEPCSSVKYLQSSSVNFEFVREYSVSIDYFHGHHQNVSFEH